METGDRVGPYELVRRLGRGGMGEVWEAVLHGPAGFRKAVALKLLRAGPGDAAQREALVREARLGALLQHPNVVGTWAVGEHRGTWHVCLELVRGAAVSELLRQGPLPAAAVVAIGLQAAAALAHVHGLVVDGRPAGLVHCDVKPANLLVDRTGLVKLADLGVSVLRGESGRAGTLPYMAPEQAAGRPEARSDLFSLGATLYTLATGRRPFGSGVEVLAAHARLDRVVDGAGFLARVEAAVPGLGAIVRRCLRADPADRPASARELGDELLAIRSRQPAGPMPLELLLRAVPGLAPAEDTPRPSEVTTLLREPGNLSRVRDRFVGREDELAGLEALVLHGDARWIVLLGLGGMGKTRLALEAARRVRPALPGGAWTLDLTEARDEDGVSAAVAAALGLVLDRLDPVGQIGRVLAGKGRALFLLDNLEQCVAALPGTVARWVDAAPDGTFLGTSRVATALRGERLVPVGELAPTEAQALLAARSPRPLTAEERAEAPDLCAELEGVPLAIELAASRLRTLSLGEVRRRLSLRLLSGGGPELPARHRSLEASLAWSWELLGPAARSALGQLSVFEGGFTLDAAEAVLDLATHGAWALDVVQELADASLLRVHPRDGRFSMLVVVREFAARAPERPAALVRHGHWFAQLGSPDATAALERHGGTERRRALAVELDNLIAACRAAVARGDGPVALATLQAVWRVVVLQGPARVALDLAEAVLKLPLDPSERALALLQHARALRNAGRFEEARVPAEAALAIHRERHDRGSEARVLTELGTLSLEQDRIEEARTHLEAALAFARERGHAHEEAGALGDLGTVFMSLRRWPEARDRLERALEVARALGDRRREMVALGTLGLLEQWLERPAEAQAAIERCLAVAREIGDRASQGLSLGNLGQLYLETGRLDLARPHLAEAIAIHVELGTRHAEAVDEGNLGSVELADGRPDVAEAHFRRALAIHSTGGNRRSLAIAHGNLGTLYLSRGDLAAARTALTEAIALFREAGDPVSEGIAHGHLARAALLAGDLDDANAHLDAARPLVEGSGAESARLHLVRAEAARSSGDLDRARRELATAEALAPPGRADVAREVERTRRLVDP